jgi:D-glycero-D-manno-heptose 1,7-bisphosphate phosphatase
MDRDGVIVRRLPGYATDWRDIQILPGVIDALARMSEMGHRLFVLTNQSAVGRGLMTREALDDIHRRLAKRIAAEGGVIEAFLVCPHAPDEGCMCRKPNPGLFHIAAREYRVSLASSYMIGDSETDIAAAHAAGCCAILVLSGVAKRDERSSADLVVNDLQAAARHILNPHGA